MCLHLFTCLVDIVLEETPKVLEDQILKRLNR